jgi:homoserine O-acetyltransferase
MVPGTEPPVGTRVPPTRRPPPPATGAFRPGDPVGRRRFVDLPGPLRLESGATLPTVRLAYETWGTPAPARDNAVLVLHALTGDSHAAGPAGPGHRAAGWWDPLIGPGRPLDTDRFWVVCPNVLGGCQGSTGPAAPGPDGRPWGGRWPDVTVGDQVRAEQLFADALRVGRWASVVGGSMGGMRALEWLVAAPDRVCAGVVLACGAAATAEQIGLYTTQIAAIEADPRWAGGDYHDAPPGHGPHVGMGLARRMGQVSYRSETELEGRFDRQLQPDGRYAVQSYLEHHADKLARRFDAGSYVTLTRSMITQDVGRGRGGVTAALRRVRGPVVVAGIDSDRLYPLRLQRELAAGLGADLHVVASPYGHDGFLLEAGAVGELIRSSLAPCPV